MAIAGDTVPSPSSTGTITTGNPDQLLCDDANDDAFSTNDANSPIVAAPAANLDIPDPKSFRQATATSNPFRAEWKKATDAEINSHRSIGTWKQGTYISKTRVLCHRVKRPLVAHGCFALSEAKMVKF